MMRALCLLITLFFVPSVQGTAQLFFAPEVVVNTSGVAEYASREMEELEKQLNDLLVSYAPNLLLTELPKNPIRVLLLLNISSVSGTEYVGDLELTMYRPIYGKEQESLIYVAGERDVRFRFQREMTRGLSGRSIPNDPLQARVFFHATMGLLYYYDSFSIYGGTPFLDYLEREQGQLENTLNDGITIGGKSAAERARKTIADLKSDWGERFRELWYIYHRSGLDAGDENKYAQSLNVVFSGLKAIRSENSTLGFLPFFSDTKRGEMRSFFSQDKSLTRANLRGMADDLFPNLLSRL